MKSPRCRRPLIDRVGLLLAAALANVSQTSAVTLHPGSQLIARLETPVSCHVSPQGAYVRAAVVGVLDGDALWMPPAGLVIEGTASTAAHRGLGRRSLLTIRFDRMLISQGLIAARFRLTEIDNAPDSVDGLGMIHGPNPWASRRGKPEDALLLATPAVPVVLFPWAAAKLLLSGLVHPRIRLAVGQELKLTTDEPIEVPDLIPLVSDLDAELETLLESQPAQTTAHGGRHGSDLTNVALVGSKDEILHAFDAAGWFQPEALSPMSDVKVFAALAHPHSYRRAPVSTLLLEGRRPDLVFEKQSGSLARRHHVRLWLLPVTYRGQAVWLGAGTHDVGIAVRRRALGFTHAVHREIDQERTKIILDLAEAHWVNKVTFLDRTDAPRHSRNGTGDRLDTDGRLAVIELQPPESHAPPQADNANHMPEVF